MDDLGVMAVWATGRRLPPVARPRAVLKGLGLDLTGLTVGRRNLLLLAERRRHFGDRLDAEADCPSCGERLELGLGLGALLASAHAGDEEGTAEAAGHTVTFRVPTCGDLEAAAATGDPASAVTTLLERCVIEARGPSGPVPATALPAPVLAAVEDAMAAADPYAHLSIAADCAVCGAAIGLWLDPGHLYWTELVARARRLMGEVHRLATAYGWSEHDILAMDPVRRAGYLELVG
ncbi:hypothetical protein Afil01_63130 [Actinorhabdospora filicis]|uniref:Phage baseplate protein n=1 Tax=Actinorhabdospora filicis TaxID=1785913 RepID=A0A9W6SVH5_9ACTN|nr:hypothetical protein [Actinorhabdospora filicis]GLZ81506.1 hypothetical protein Afil01_63130 [Actinorhabdospora filicis]